jgi:hypothetical protein
MANGTKAAKLFEHFAKHPNTTIREAATACNTSYNSAWAVRKKICDDEVTARAAEIAPVVSIAAPPAVSVSDGSTASVAHTAMDRHLTVIACVMRKRSGFISMQRSSDWRHYEVW